MYFYIESVHRVVIEKRTDSPGFLIGLTGVIGSGKSTAARFFQEAGCHVIDADRVAKDQLNDPSIAPQLKALFPEAHEGNVLSKEKLAGIVFQSRDRLKALTDLTHPGVRRVFKEKAGMLSPTEILVYDVPLLFEGNLQGDFDLVVCVRTENQTRIQRLLARGISQDDIKRREELQLSSAEKENRADLVLNNGGLGELKSSVTALVKQIQEFQSKRRVV